MTDKKQFTGRAFTPRAYYDCLKVLGWSVHAFARRAGVHETRARRWGKREIEIPAEIWQRICHIADVILNTPLRKKSEGKKVTLSRRKDVSNVDTTGN